LVGILLSLFTAVLGIAVIALELAAPLLARLLAGGFVYSDPELLNLTIFMIRLVAPTVFFLCLAGVMTAILYSMHRFTFPALATAVYNLGVVLSAPLLAPKLGVLSLIIGLLLGSILQCAMMIWDMQRAGVLGVWRLRGRHSGLQRIVRLYTPIAIGLIVASLQAGLDRRLASGAGAQSIAWMANATTLQQLPLGLISIAISLAALPTLSQYFASGDEAAYRQTLARSLRIVLLFITPAAVGLWALGNPVVRILFERGKFTPVDTGQVVSALHIYLLGMLFAAIDFPLNFAFYARHNTFLPALVGIFSAVIYVIVALATLRWLGYLGLVWGDTAKQAAHALTMIGLLLWQIGPFHRQIAPTLVRVALAGIVMFLCLSLIQTSLSNRLASGLLSDLLLLLIGGSCGVVVYALCLALSGETELQPFYRRLRAWRVW
jgi:putative peptidoglycan lipid II flippase